MAPRPREQSRTWAARPVTCRSELRTLPVLGRCASAVGPDVGVAEVLAAGAFGPGLPESTPSLRTSGPALAPVTHRANSSHREKTLVPSPPCRFYTPIKNGSAVAGLPGSLRW